MEKYRGDAYYIFGVTFFGVLIAVALKARGKNVEFLDNDSKKHCSDCIDRISCISPDNMEIGRPIIIAVQSDENKLLIKKQLIGLGADNIVIPDEAEKQSLVENIDDVMYVKCLWRFNMGYELDLLYPRTFNEKLNWLKIYDRKEQYIQMADKYRVKQYVSDLIGEEFVIPTIGVWDTFDEISFETLPDKFVLKCTHDSGSVVVVKDKSLMQTNLIQKRFENSLGTNYFFAYREWPYKNVKPRIIAEELISNPNEESLVVYKLFCFNGKPKLAQVIQNDKKDNESIDYFDMDWNLLDIRQNFPNSLHHLHKPFSWNKMQKLAMVLSKGIPFVRVDFYEVERKPVFSEFTFYSDAGLKKFSPEYWDDILGDWIVI